MDRAQDQSIKRHMVPLYTLSEEIFNAVTHGLGAVLGVAALVWMLLIAVPTGDAGRIVSASIYGFSLILLYMMSTLYHALPMRAKRVFRVFDHCTIYLLIVGSYLPYLLVTLRGPLGYGMLAVIGGVAVLAIVLTAVDMQRFYVFSHICYVVLGWAVVAAILPIYRALPAAGFWLLAAGGLCYTVGLIFYGNKHRLYMHGVWHLFVLAGSVMQFFSIILFVLPL